MREHLSAETSGGEQLSTVESLHDGLVEQAAPIVVVDGTTVPVSDLRRVLEQLAWIGRTRSPARGRCRGAVLFLERSRPHSHGGDR